MIARIPCRNVKIINIIYKIILLILLILDSTHSLDSFVSVSRVTHDSTHSLQERKNHNYIILYIKSSY